ncbi:MAG: site-specific integrase, partial [Gammaproteobacteria bacterium]|nr:site-specific integrase [Gammaproteobacteria bacterium]
VERVLDWMERDPVYQNYFELAFFTGLRTSELIALQWGDVDWRRRTVTVQRARVRRERKVTKTAVIREVELHSRALDALRRQKALTFLAGDWIFLHPATGQPFNDDKPPRLVWISALKACGLRHRDAYATRHTYITLALMSGANVLWVSRQAGHATTVMTLTRYAKWIDQADQGREIGLLETALRRHVPATSQLTLPKTLKSQLKQGTYVGRRLPY